MISRVERIRVAESALPELGARIVVNALTERIEKSGHASLCLAGGSTPKALYKALTAASGPDWSKVSIYFGDERCVPPDDADSNYLMARTALLDHVPVPAANVHRMRGEDPDRQAAAAAYASELPAEITVLLLGIGEDGHTASLFPGSSALHEKERLVVPVTGPKPPPERLSVTPPVFERSGLIVMLAAGVGKADAVCRALEGELSIDECPAQLVRNAVWLMDHAAAGKLSGAWR